MVNKEKNKIVLIITVADIILFIIFVIGVSYILQHFNDSKDNKQIYEEIKNVNIIKESNVEPVTTNKISENVQKVTNLKQENKDVVGWIKIDNTIIDYPILQTTDNDYYLTHNYKKEKSKYGSIYLNKESNILDNYSNVIIYGHNMKDEQMFNTLLKYESEDFYNEHKTIKITTEQEENEYEIVSVFKSRIFYQDEQNVFRYYNYTKFKDKNTYNEFIENCKEIELYDTGVSAKYGEQLITLITCEYSQDNGRMVVVAKEIV